MDRLLAQCLSQKPDDHLPADLGVKIATRRLRLLTLDYSWFPVATTAASSNRSPPRRT